MYKFGLLCYMLLVVAFILSSSTTGVIGASQLGGQKIVIIDNLRKCIPKDGSMNSMVFVDFYSVFISGYAAATVNSIRSSGIVGPVHASEDVLLPDDLDAQRLTKRFVVYCKCGAGLDHILEHLSKILLRGGPHVKNLHKLIKFIGPRVTLTDYQNAATKLFFERYEGGLTTHISASDAIEQYDLAEESQFETPGTFETLFEKYHLGRRDPNFHKPLVYLAKSSSKVARVFYFSELRRLTEMVAYIPVHDNGILLFVPVAKSDGSGTIEPLDPSRTMTLRTWKLYLADLSQTFNIVASSSHIGSARTYAHSDLSDHHSVDGDLEVSCRSVSHSHPSTPPLYSSHAAHVSVPGLEYPQSVDSATTIFRECFGHFLTGETVMNLFFFFNYGYLYDYLQLAFPAHIKSLYDREPHHIVRERGDPRIYIHLEHVYLKDPAALPLPDYLATSMSTRATVETFIDQVEGIKVVVDSSNEKPQFIEKKYGPYFELVNVLKESASSDSGRVLSIKRVHFVFLTELERFHSTASKQKKKQLPRSVVDLKESEHQVLSSNSEELVRVAISYRIGSIDPCFSYIFEALPMTITGGMTERYLDTMEMLMEKFHNDMDDGFVYRVPHIVPIRGYESWTISTDLPNPVLTMKLDDWYSFMSEIRDILFPSRHAHSDPIPIGRVSQVSTISHSPVISWFLSLFPGQE